MKICFIKKQRPLCREIDCMGRIMEKMKIHKDISVVTGKLPIVREQRRISS